MEDISSEFPSPEKRLVWLSPLCIVCVVILGYGLGPTRMPLIGEEACRAQHGIEMAQSGDWLVATNQYVPILDRPPLQYWFLAAIHRWVHRLDPLTIRMSMLAVTMMTALMIWWYAKSFLSGTAAFLAGVAYPTMGHVFDLGRRAETDGLFTLLMAASLIVWHYGYLNRWRNLSVWSCGCFFAALATLTKGTQGPVAFFGAIYLFLIVKRDWRCLISWSHVAGIAIFLGTIAIWQVPFHMRVGMAGTKMTWLVPFSARLSVDLIEVILHIFKFPFVVLIASLPWSALVLGLFHPSFRKMDSRPSSAATFLIIGIMSIFCPVWLSAGGVQRYIMPMYPLLAVVCGIVADCALSSKVDNMIRRFYFSFLRNATMATGVCAWVFVVATIIAGLSDASWATRLAQPLWLAAVLAAASACAVVLVLKSSQGNLHLQAFTGTLILASMMAILFNGPVINAQINGMNDVRGEVAALRDRLPKDARLVSFGTLNHRFYYHFDERVPIVPLPQTIDEVSDDLEYFAVTVHSGKPLQKLPFPWEQLARIQTGRGRNQPRQQNVIVGRRTMITRQAKHEAQPPRKSPL